MLMLGFYFLLHPGEYANTSNPDLTPFRLQDVHLHRGDSRINHLTCPLPDLQSSSFVCLGFTTQKNGVCSELIGLGRSGNLAFCPVQACLNCILHLRTYQAPPHTPLYTYFCDDWQAITTTMLTSEIRSSTAVMGHTVGLSPPDVSVRSLRASGAMALLCANVVTDCIHLLGCWRSDKTLHYLHVQAYPVVAHLAPAMLQHGQFTLIPNTPVQLPGQVPG